MHLLYLRAQGLYIFEARVGRGEASNLLLQSLLTGTESFKPGACRSQAIKKPPYLGAQPDVRLSYAVMQHLYLGAQGAYFLPKEARSLLNFRNESRQLVHLCVCVCVPVCVRVCVSRCGVCAPTAPDRVCLLVGSA